MQEPLNLVIVARRMLTADICQFELRDAMGTSLPRFEAGSHIKITTPSGHVRSYSLNNDETESDRYVISVKRDDFGRGGSISMHADAKVGDVIGVSPPENALALVQARRYLLIAGGIGITPVMSFLRKFEREGVKDYHMIYCTRTPQQTAYLEELRSVSYASRLTIHHTAGGAGRFDFWPWFRTPDDTHIYYCGPTPMMDAIYAQTIHWPRSALHYEDFTGVSGVGLGSRSFVVRRAMNGDEITIPADKSIVEVFRDMGLKPKSSCESGTCGTCRVRLIDGEPEHRDVYLKDEERGAYFIPCVSRAAGERITLDI